MNKIRNLQIVEKDGEIISLSVIFGAHYMLTITAGKSASLTIVATHHGVKLDASTPGEKLDEAIDYLRKRFKDDLVD